MNKRLSSLLPVLVLTGCASADIDYNFSHVVGQPVEQLTQRLGPPAAVLDASDVRVVEWKLKRRDPLVHMPLTMVSHDFSLARDVAFLSPISSGTSSMLFYSAQSSIPSYSPLRSARPDSTSSRLPSPDLMLTGYSVCKLRVAMDNSNTVLDYQFEGEINACYSVSRNFTNKG